LFYFRENNEKRSATLHVCIVTEKRTSFCWLRDSRVVNRVSAWSVTASLTDLIG